MARALALLLALTATPPVDAQDGIDDLKKLYEYDAKAPLVLKLGPKPRAFPLTHFDRDTYTYQPEGEMAAGLSGVTFRVGPDRVAAAVTIENLDMHGSGTLTRAPAGR